MFTPKRVSGMTLIVMAEQDIISYFSIIADIKVKNDHRSKFSNLSNWKEEA